MPDTAIAPAAPTTAAPATPTSLATMNAEQLTEALRGDQLGFSRRDAVDRLASLLTAPPGAPVPVAPAAASGPFNLQSIPTAADQGTIVGAEAKSASLIANVYAPAKSPADYELDVPPNASPEQLAAIQESSEALHAAGLSEVVGKRIGNTLQSTVTGFEKLDATQVMAFADAEIKALRDLWGDAYEPRISAYIERLLDAARTSPLIAEMLTDPRIFALTHRQVVAAVSQEMEARASATRRA
jgi:hypothetical protein